MRIQTGGPFCSMLHPHSSGTGHFWTCWEALIKWENVAAETAAELMGKAKPCAQASLTQQRRISLHVFLHSLLQLLIAKSRTRCFELGLDVVMEFQCHLGLMRVALHSQSSNV